MPKVPEIAKAQFSPVLDANPRRREPLITLEAGRMALRRIDLGDLAKQSIVRSSDAISALISSQRQFDDGIAARTSLSNVKEHPDRPTVKCWVCQVFHFYYENEECKNAHEAKRDIKSKSSVRKNKSGDKVKLGATTLSSVLWSDAQETVYNKVTYVGCDVQEALPGLGAENCDHPINVIDDGGAAATVIGLKNYVRLCEDQGLDPKIFELEACDFSSRAFGTEENHSKPQLAVGRCELPLAISEDSLLRLSCLVIDGDFPLLIGKGALVKDKCIESHDGNWLSFEVGNQVIRLPTESSIEDGHSRVTLCGDALNFTVAKSIIQEVTDGISTVSMVRRIYSQTHLHLRSEERLLSRAKKWTPNMAAEVANVQVKCISCIHSGDSLSSNKFSMSRIHLNLTSANSST